MGDPLLVRQSLINLIQNALRYTQQGGVLIAIRPRGAECLVEVWDTGVGIADEEKSKIFSPYYRPELAWKIDSAGHGLGLAVVARCAKLMKVKYGMHSVEGKGSRFWMRFTQYIGEDKAPETAAAYDNTATPIRYAPLRLRWWTTILGDLRTGEPDEHTGHHRALRGLRRGSLRHRQRRLYAVRRAVRPAPAFRRERFRHPQSAVRTPAGRERRHGQRRVQLADIARGRAGRLSGAAQTAGAGQAACAADAVGGGLAHIEGYQAMISRLNSNCWISCRCDKIACAVTNLSSTEYKTR